ncbi:MAG: hypothetical protein AAFV53_29650 [Myxococcota bacterium]
MSTVILPDRFARGLLQGKRVYWLVTIEFGGAIIRLSTADLNVPGGDVIHRYWGLLQDLQYGERIDVLEDVNEGASVAIQTIVPYSIAEMEAQGKRFEGSRAELARWVEGTRFEDRRVVLIGEVTDPEYAADAEPVSFSIEQVVWKEDVIVPTSRQRVDGATWPDGIASIAVEERGLYYPIIFGFPGRTSAVDRGWITGSQGRWIDRRSNTGPGGTETDLELVIAGHEVTAERVYMNTDANVAGERFRVFHKKDGRGQTVAYIDEFYDPDTLPVPLSTNTESDGITTVGLGAASIDPSFQPQPSSIDPAVAPIFVGWLDDIAGGGGMKARDGGTVRELGEVLEVMLGYTNKPIDRERFRAIAPLLSRYKIDCVIDAQVRPWSWIRSNLLPIAPIGILSGPKGLYPVLWRFDATREDAVAHINASANPTVQRASSVVIDSSKIRNQFELDYAISIRTGAYFSALRLGPGPYDDSDPDTLPSLYCRLSQQRYRYPNGKPKIVEEKLESIVIYDRATALATLQWRARAYALAHRYVDYVVLESDFGNLERGSVVLLTDDELFIEEWICIVVDMQSDDSGTVGLRLLRIEDPPRDGLRSVQPG